VLPIIKSRNGRNNFKIINIQGLSKQLGKFVFGRDMLSLCGQQKYLILKPGSNRKPSFFPYFWHFCYTMHSTWNRYLYFNPADSKSVVTVFPSYWDSSPHLDGSHQSQFGRGGEGVNDYLLY
jgi:hypothetical protein